jgi:hypothetical protein
MFFFSYVPSSFSLDCLEGICRKKKAEKREEILAITYITSPHAFSRYMLVLCTYCEVLFLEYCAVELRTTLAARSLVLHLFSLTRDLTPSSSSFSVCISGSELLLCFVQTNKHQRR